MTGWFANNGEWDDRACHCFTGLSSQAIACEAHTDHPWDPADLRRCVEYRKRVGLTVAALRTRMADRSPAWNALLPIWAELEASLAEEMATRSDGRAPRTYQMMREALGR